MKALNCYYKLESTSIENEALQQLFWCKKIRLECLDISGLINTLEVWSKSCLGTQQNFDNLDLAKLCLVCNNFASCFEQNFA